MMKIQINDVTIQAWCDGEGVWFVDGPNCEEETFEKASPTIQDLYNLIERWGYVD